jgi:hypothetical protein
MEEFSQEMTAIDKTSVGMDKITPTIQPEGGSLPTAPKMLTSEAKNRQKTGKHQRGREGRRGSWTAPKMSKASA